MKSKMLENVDFVINKVTDRCNLRCKYCSVNAGGDAPSHTMPLDTFKEAVDLVFDSSSQKRVKWLFHGGEPLTVKLDWYADAVEYLKESGRRREKAVAIDMQTNCTLISDEAISFIKEHNIKIGTSLDGPPGINDLMRADGEKVLDGILKLRSAGCDPGLIALINHVNYNRMDEIIDFFMENGIERAKFNVCYSVGRGKGSERVLPSHLFEAKKTILDRMLKEKGEFSDTNLAESIQSYFRPKMRHIGRRSGCHGLYCGAGRKYLCIGPDGTIYPCGRASDAGSQWVLGSVGKSLRTDRYSKKLDKFHTKGLWYERCLNCRASSICTFGCTAFAKASDDNEVLECEYTLKMFDYFMERVEEIRELDKAISEKARKMRKERASETEGDETGKGGVPQAEPNPFRAVEYTANAAANLPGRVLWSRPGCYIIELNGGMYLYDRQSKQGWEIDDIAYDALATCSEMDQEEKLRFLSAKYGEAEAREALEEISEA